MGNEGQSQLPEHIAIIMDGNGRWAKKRKRPRIFGHTAGIKTVKKIVKYAGEIGIQYLTLYTFSTENWKRPKDEVSGLMKLFYDNLISQIDELNQNNVQLKTIGDTSKLPEYVQEKLNEAIKNLSSNTGLTLVLALNYGSRDEIQRAIIKIVNDYSESTLASKDMEKDILSKYLDTYNMPDPDLVIRTSGEFRLSNFLLYQSAYSEFYITEKYWPDFDEKEFQKAIDFFQQRERRYGAV